MEKNPSEEADSSSATQEIPPPFKEAEVISPPSHMIYDMI
jgi:hypothetical protein